jgi:hypothetical protein
MMGTRNVRVATWALIGCAGVLAVAAPAHADSGTATVQCGLTRAQPGCVTATDAPAVGSALVPDGSCPPTDTPTPSCDSVHGWPGADGCHYRLTDPSPQTAFGMGNRPLDTPGVWYIRTCTDPSSQALVFLTQPPVDAPQALAAHARAAVTPPPPQPLIGPAGNQQVGLAVGLWLTPESWHPVSATVSGPTATLHATATPAQVVWQTGDATAEICTGPGTPPPADASPAWTSPDCGHIYRQPSSTRGGHVYTVTVTVLWDVSWDSGGESGTTAPITTTATTSVHID